MNAMNDLMRVRAMKVFSIQLNFNMPNILILAYGRVSARVCVRFECVRVCFILLIFCIMLHEFGWNLILIERIFDLFGRTVIDKAKHFSLFVYVMYVAVVVVGPGR